MIPPILNDAGDCCCQCPPNGQDGWCHCNDDYNGKGDDIENAITCDLVWTEVQANGRKKYFKVVSGSSHQNMPVVLPTASLKKRGVVQLTNDLSDREDLALTPKGARAIKTELDKEVADRVANDNALQGQLNQEKTDRASADKDLSDRITQETTDRKTADNALSSSITNVSNRVTSVESKANNSVTSVTSNGDATVTVTKTDGTSSNFTINNVAHATSADTATKATNADHALVADRLASGSDVDTSSILGFPDYSKGVGLIFKDALNQPHSPTMTSNGFVVVSCFVEAGSNTEGETVTAKTNIEVNAHSILSLTKQSSMGGGVELRTMLCFPVKKGDTVFVSVGASHSSAGDPISGDVSATFFPCL